MNNAAVPAVDAYSEACQRGPSIVRDNPSPRRVGLYAWRTGPTREVHIGKTRELILSVHLAGARRVRVFTEQGLTQSFSRPGDITLVPREQAISYRTEGEVKFATLHFPLESPGGLLDPVADTLSALEACLFARRDEFAVSSVKTLLQAAQAGDPGNTQYLSAMFEALSLHIARIVQDCDAEQIRPRDGAPQIARGPNFDEVERQIEARLAEKLTLLELAACPAHS